MLSTHYQKVRSLSVFDIMRMHAIFEANYANGPIGTFMTDLSKKDGVFLVRKKSTDEIVGFSTLGIHEFQHQGRTVRGLFSGDTIIEKAYWGSRTLQTAFALKLFTEALKRPFSRQYWLLISKGYKTYLLLSKNFPEHYPRRGQDDNPHLKALVINYCEALFPGKLDRALMTLDFGDHANCLKQDVAGIDEALRAREPDVAFFEELNPNWQRGTELPCIGRADLAIFLWAIWPFLWKALVKPAKRKTAASAAGVNQVV
ncbi:hypothetical protein [Aquabacterium sp.]|uniref:hypothetical protein n=1 Tax=Aquabacterium sp. TaxID=1872578 RepID=UPI00248989AE|nr:hypothetical protein [Aquabacterium sp.]MDI1258584.1 hypothetical protein [Aquabacterium sp.]